MKKVILVFAGAFLLGASSVAIMANQYEPTLPQGAIVGKVPVGGLTKDQARKNLRTWWEAERIGKVTFIHQKFKPVPAQMSWTSAGLNLDDEASINQIPLDGFWSNAQRSIGAMSQAGTFPVQFKINEDKFQIFEKWVNTVKPAIKPANVQWDGNKLVKRYEGTTIAFDHETYGLNLPTAFLEKVPVEIPIISGTKKVSDEEVDKIVSVAATFSTRFPANNRPRCINIQIAAGYIDGYVMMPGDVFSFNEVVQARTRKRGFKEAGVYVNGRHDTGIGGGICQVSSTLYNAALLANLKIVQRTNHSLPVPYVPLGQDSTVSYPHLDLKFENSTPLPISVDLVYLPGKLTASILGVKNPNMKITIERGRASSKSNGVAYKHNPNLPFGKTLVIDKGGSSRRISTWRVITEAGKPVRRESLGQSHYPGAPMLIARNMKSRKPVAAPSPSAPNPVVYGPVPGQGDSE